MGDELHEQHHANLMRMDPEKRMTYFLTTVTNSEVVYGLQKDGRWLTVLDEDSGRSVFPVWPHAQLAEEVAKDNWADATPEAVPLGDWLAFTRRLEEDNGLIAVMMRPDGDHLVVEPGRHRADLENFMDEDDYLGLMK